MSERLPMSPGRRPGFGRGLFIGRLFGIDFFLDYSWFLIAAVITYTWSTSVFPSEGWVPGRTLQVYWLMGSSATFLFFISLLLHELGHSLVSQRCGIPVPRITLLFIGGVAEISREPDDAKSELKIALGGPIVSLGLAAMFLGGAGLFTLGGLEAPRAVCLWLAFTNVMLVIFNMIPGYPLDGGRVLRAVIWHYTGKLHRATFITSRIGIGFSWLLILLGVGILIFQPQWGGLVYILIGFFLKSAAENGYANALQREVLAGVYVRDIMTKAPVCLPDTMPLNLAVDEVFLANHHEALPVVAADGEFRGVLRIEHIKDIPRERWPYVTAGDLAAEKDTLLLKLEADTSASRAMRRLLSPGTGRLAVTEDGKIVGMITRHDILHFIKIHVQLDA